MADEPARPRLVGSDAIENDGMGPSLAGGGSSDVKQADQPTYTRAVASSSTGGLIASIVVAVVLLAIPLAWGIGVVSAVAQGLGLRLDDGLAWLVYAGFVLLVALIVWTAWNVFTKSFSDTGQYPR